MIYTHVMSCPYTNNLLYWNQCTNSMSSNVCFYSVALNLMTPLCLVRCSKPIVLTVNGMFEYIRRSDLTDLHEMKHLLDLVIVIKDIYLLI